MKNEHEQEETIFALRITPASLLRTWSGRWLSGATCSVSSFLIGRTRLAILPAKLPECPARKFQSPFSKVTVTKLNCSNISPRPIENMSLSGHAMSDRCTSRSLWMISMRCWTRSPRPVGKPRANRKLFKQARMPGSACLCPRSRWNNDRVHAAAYPATRFELAADFAETDLADASARETDGRSRNSSRCRAPISSL